MHASEGRAAESSAKLSKKMLDLATGLEEQVFSALALGFFDVVPLEYQTYCALTARVMKTALERFSIRSELVPCQMWYAAPERNHVVGFVGNEGTPGKWDGHVICATDRWFVDAAVHHLARDIGVKVPRVIAGVRFGIPSQAIARFDLSPTERIWWHHAPPGTRALPPQEPAALVERLSDALHARAQAKLARA